MYQFRVRENDLWLALVYVVGGPRTLAQRTVGVAVFVVRGAATSVKYYFIEKNIIHYLHKIHMYKEFASTYIWEVVFLAQNVNRNDAKFVMIFSSCVKKKCKKFTSCV